MFPFVRIVHPAPLNRPTPSPADPASPGTPADPPSVALRAALVGYGAWGVNVARNADRLPGCRLVAISDRLPVRLDLARGRHPHARVAADWEAFLGDATIDALFIATPADTHYPLALAALRDGKHVFVEKPMTGSAAHARRLTDEASGRGRVLMVDHTYVFSPAIRAVATALAGGAIGRPSRYTSRRCNASAGRSDVSVHWDLAVHDLAILDHLLSHEAPEVVATRLDHDAGATPSAVRLELEWSGSLFAAIEVAWNAPAKVRDVAIEGTHGRVDFADLESPHKVRVRAHGGEVAPVLEDAEPLLEAIRHFAACVGGRARPLADGRAGLRVVRILEAADRSLALGGRPIGVEPEAAAA